MTLRQRATRLKVTRCFDCKTPLNGNKYIQIKGQAEVSVGINLCKDCAAQVAIKLAAAAQELNKDGND